ncbi:hypothetical protein EG327_008204 [Venturia inaequalis]|uniref:Uncharacterized protein n=1 Tax=Venturia inaequalis TaxID=5025 RepID=A0A8H3UT62_VENIN|nr:hypothetical protein EG327_008204 [Venturia inaequalis]
MKVVLTLATVLLAGTVYADYSTCQNGAKSGLCVMHFDSGGEIPGWRKRLCRD